MSIEAHMPMVRRMATQLSKRVPAHVEQDELVSAGLEGLVRASRRFDANRGVKFGAFATFHVRGAMIEHLRHLDIMSRNERRLKNSIARAKEQLCAELTRKPTEREVAMKLGMPVAEYRNVLSRLGDARLMSTSQDDGQHEGRRAGIHLSASDPTPEEQLIRDEAPLRMWAAVEALPTRQREVIELAHRDALTLAEIGKRLGISESRVSQIRKAAIQNLRRKLVVSSPAANRRRRRASIDKPVTAKVASASR